MTRPLPPKQEKFCQVYIETGIASEAYRQAYNTEGWKPNSVHINASKLLSDTKVALRIEELQAEHQERHNVTIDSLTEEYEEHRLAAFEDEQYAVCNTATTGKAKIHGLIADKPVMDLNITINLISFEDEE